jgi:cytochrome P450
MRPLEVGRRREQEVVMNVREKVGEVAQRGVVSALCTVERVRYGVAWNPLTPAYREDPYPSYRALHEKDPVHRTMLLKGWLLTRYEDVSSALRDVRFLADDRKTPTFETNQQRMVQKGIYTEEESRRDSPAMLRTDPPDHTRLRGLVSKAFTPRAIEALRPRVEQIVAELLDSANGQGQTDVIRTLAYPLPVTVIAEMLGLPVEDREQFKRWSDDLVLSLGIQNWDEMRRAIAAQRELRAYIKALAEERRREPREDLLSGLVAAEDAGDKLNAEEVFNTVMLLLVAGNETTTNLIGNGLLALLRNPEQWELLKSKPELTETAIEELLRYDSPVQNTSRFTTEEVEVDGHTIKPFEAVGLILGAANRDPERYPNPDTLDITREKVEPLSFGNGIHFCLGAPLARMEGAIAFRALIERYPHISLATDKPEWGDNIILRGLKSLPVKV